jgi:four helix bundle protein
MRDFRQLNVWNKSYQLTLDIYRASRGFPKEELYGLTSQLRRSAASVPANIAEGCGRDGNVELSRFFQIAMGSASEFHSLLARDIGLLAHLQHEQLAQQVVEVKRMLTSYRQKLKTSPRLKADG